jgi:hypothetical protein
MWFMDVTSRWHHAIAEKIQRRNNLWTNLEMEDVQGDKLIEMQRERGIREKSDLA